MKKPNVLVAGFPRSGSTYIYQILKQHPDIFIPKIKEINYFNKDNFFLEDPTVLNPRYFKAKEWYFNFFNTNKKIVMDFSILSSFDVGSAIRVNNLLGDIKIIFITRNKEDYMNSIQTIITNWKSQSSNHGNFGNIDYYMGFYYSIFSNVYILNMGIFNEDPNKEMQRLMRFLGIKQYYFNFKVNRHKSKDSKPISNFDLFRRKSYIWFNHFFFKIIARSVRGKTKVVGAEE